MADAKVSQARRGTRLASRAAKNRPAAAAAAQPAKAAARPANKRGKLTDALKEEVRELHAQGISLREIGRRVGIVHSGVFALLRQRGAPKPRRWSRRYSNCGYCGAPIPVSGSVTRSTCERCTDRLCPTIWRAGDPIQALPKNLLRYLES